MTAAGLMRMKLAEEFAKKACREWSSMWHNATIREWPKGGYDSDEFNNWLYGPRVDLCKYLSDQVNEKWGFKWTFYQWGRSGATIAPAELKSMDRHFNRHLGPDDLWSAEVFPWMDQGDDMQDEDARYCAESAKAHLEAFQYINETVREAVRSIPEAWKEYQGKGELRKAM